MLHEILTYVTFFVPINQNWTGANMLNWEVIVGAIVDFVFEAVVAFVNTQEGDAAAHKLIAIVEGKTPAEEQSNSASNEQAIDVTKRIAQLAEQFLGVKS